MKFPFRRRGAGRARIGGAPAGENPFADFDRATRPSDAEDEPQSKAAAGAPDSGIAVRQDGVRSGSGNALVGDRLVAGEPRPRKRARADAPANAAKESPPRRRPAPRIVEQAVERPSLTPRQRLRRLVVFSALFLLVMPAVPVTLLRYLPPPASAMMVKRWVDARVAGRDFELRYDWVAHERIARSLRAAVVASEDQRFYDHDGFDWKELRSAVDDWRDGDGLRGASTISQLVAKNLFLWPGRSFVRKGFEAWFTIWIEWVWPKKRILEVYLNIAEMGDGVFGAEAAARRYFKRPASGLTAPESALLAAALPSPLRSNPGNPSTYLRKRQRWILRQI